MKRNKLVWLLGGGILAFAVAAAIAVALNVLASGVRLRWDLTEEKVYTLSEGSRSVLKDLPAPVTLKFFFSESDPAIPMQVKNYAQRVEDLLREYQAESKGKLVFEKYDPKPDTDAEDWARRYGVTGQSVGLMGPQVYLGLVAVMGDREAALPVLDPQGENLLEYNITRMISGVAHPKKPVVGVLSSLPVMGGAPPMAMMGGPQQRTPAWYAFQDMKESYEVRMIDPGSEEIPAELDTLVLVHPKDLSDRTLYALDQFVLRGGRMIAFMDPMCMTEMQSSPMPQMGMGQGPSNLDKLLKAWGVTFESGKIVCDLGAATRLRGQQNQVEESPVWLSLQRDNCNKTDISTAQLENLMMPFAGSFTATSTKELTVTPLVTTSDSSGLVDPMAAQFGFRAVEKDFVNGGKPLNLAVRLSGTLKTAFPDGQPKLEGVTNAPAATPAGLKESKGKSSVVLVGDVDMLSDRIAVTEIPDFLGQRGVAPANDNIALLYSLVEQASGSASLASIRTRGKTSRPFEVVREIQRKAEERYLQEEVALQQKLEQAQQRLAELQTTKEKGQQQLILSPEQKREIEQFRKNEYDTKQQLKLVRRALREDIATLGMKVKAVNILLMPFLVILAGISIGIYRRNRR